MGDVHEHDPAATQDPDTVQYEGPAGGWGSVRGMSRIFGAELDNPAITETLMRQNKPGGFMCVSCAWTKPANYHKFEFCENGANARVLRPAHRRRTEELDRFRARTGRPDHPSDALRSGERQIHSGRLG